MFVQIYLVEKYQLVNDIQNSQISVVWMSRSNLSFIPAHGGHVGAAGMSVPSAVGISGQAALGACLTIKLTLVQAQLRHTLPGTHKQPLLEMREGCKVEREME